MTRRNWLPLLALAISTCSLAACGGNTAGPTLDAALSAAPAAAAGLDAGIPFPADRSASGLTDNVLLGKLTEARSIGAVDQGTAVKLNAAPAGIEYALYRFNAGANAPDSVSVLLEEAATTGAYIGLANYTTGRWEFSGPYTKQKSFVLDDGKHLSPSDNIWVAVVTAASQNATVDALSVRTINPANVAPTAVLGANVTSANAAPLTVYFDAGLSTDSDGQIIEYAWDWDGDGIFDGQTDTPQAAHTFTQPGKFDVTLRVTDDQFARATASQLIDIGNAPPVVVVTATPGSDGAPGSQIDLDSTGSTDEDGSIAGYEWDLDGNGSFETTGVNHIFSFSLPATAGELIVSVRATDNEGATAVGSLTLTAHGWAAPAQASSAGGSISSMAIVDGRPAMAFVYNVNFPPPAPEIGELFYVRALDANGTQWEDPILLDQTGKFHDVSLKVVAGRPAVAYSVDTDNNFFVDAYQLCYLRASNEDGTAWGTPQLVDNSSVQIGASCSLDIIHGNPAIAYQDATNNTLMYKRAATATGGYWNFGPGLIVDMAVPTGADPSLLALPTGPAIACTSITSQTLRFSAAQDADGNAWPPALVLDSNSGSFGTGVTPSMTLVSGNPAIAYEDSLNSNLQYLRATSPNGASWPAAPITIDVLAAGLGSQPSLAVVGGKPAISYAYDDFIDFNLQYAQALNTDGSSWGVPVTADALDASGHASNLLELDGMPLIGYFCSSFGQPRFTRLY